jgi:hypothetical protein
MTFRMFVLDLKLCNIYPFMKDRFLEELKQKTKKGTAGRSVFLTAVVDVL